MKKVGLLILTLPLIVVSCKKEPVETLCNHQYDTNFVYNDHDHWKECILCHARIDVENHTMQEEIIQEAKCEENGEKRLYCTKCDYEKHELIAKLNHQYGEVVITEPTTTSEGSYNQECSICESKITKKILKLPSKLVMESNVISWSEVEHADGYILKIGAEEIDVGSLTSYTLDRINSMDDTIQVYAYTLDEDYYLYDGESTKSNLTLCKENIQSDYNFNFENNSRIRLNRIGGWNNYPYGNWSDINQDSNLGGHYYIEEEPDGNMAAKIPAVVWWPGNTTLKRDLGSGCWSMGTYEISFDIKASEAALNYHSNDHYGTIKGYLWNPHNASDILYIKDTSSTFNDTGLVIKDIPGISTTEYTNVRLRYTLNESVIYNQLNIIYWPEQEIGEENYIMIDNIQVFKVNNGVAIEENIDNNIGGDFEVYNQSNMDHNIWYANNTILPENNALGSSVMKEENQNQALKILSKDGDIAQINLAGNAKELQKGGLYQMSFDVKKNAHLESADLKFQMWGFKAGQACDLTGEVDVDLSHITDSFYQKVNVNFATQTIYNLDSINIFITVNFNNTGNKENSYILIDNVEIHKIILGEDLTTNILFIGNSFADDTIEYAYPILDNLGIDTTNINLYALFFGGCSIEQHYNFFVNNYANCYLRAYDKERKCWYNLISFCSLKQALSLHSNWDIISFQQASHAYDNFEKFEKLPLFAQEVRNLVGENTSFVFNGTWSYREDAPEILSQGYGTQKNMYEKIIEIEKNLMSDTYAVQFDKLIPSTTSIQNGRQVYGQDGLNRDDRHLSFGLGRFIASLTMVETLFNVDICNVTYKPNGVTDDDLANAILFAKSAILSPFELTNQK